MKWHGLTEDGKRIPLEKECDCIIHDGPHWIHMDRLKRHLNKKYLENPTDSNMRAFNVLELARLNEKHSHFDRLQIIEVAQEGSIE